MTRVIPVLDLKGGRAVHAVAGSRDDYRPLRSSLRPGSDPIAFATAFRDDFGLTELYLADLDAINGEPPSLALYEQIAALGMNLWVDAGLRDASLIPSLASAGVARPIAALETLQGPDALESIVAASSPGSAVFSLDLREGWPIIAEGAVWPITHPAEIAEEAINRGAGTVIVLDITRVGTNQGVNTLSLVFALSCVYPEASFITGGGVSSWADVASIGQAGAVGALVASALHNGMIQPR